MRQFEEWERTRQVALYSCVPVLKDQDKRKYLKALGEPRWNPYSKAKPKPKKTKEDHKRIKEFLKQEFERREKVRKVVKVFKV